MKRVFCTIVAFACFGAITAPGRADPPSFENPAIAISLCKTASLYRTGLLIQQTLTGALRLEALRHQQGLGTPASELELLSDEASIREALIANYREFRRCDFPCMSDSSLRYLADHHPAVQEFLRTREAGESLAPFMQFFSERVREARHASRSTPLAVDAAPIRQLFEQTIPASLLDELRNRADPAENAEISWRRRTPDACNSELVAQSPPPPPAPRLTRAIPAAPTVEIPWHPWGVSWIPGGVDPSRLPARPLFFAFGDFSTTLRLQASSSGSGAPVLQQRAFIAVPLNMIGFSGQYDRPSASGMSTGGFVFDGNVRVGANESGMTHFLNAQARMSLALFSISFALRSQDEPHFSEQFHADVQIGLNTWIRFGEDSILFLETYFGIPGAPSGSDSMRIGRQPLPLSAALAAVPAAADGVSEGTQIRSMHGVRAVLRSRRLFFEAWLRHLSNHGVDSFPRSAFPDINLLSIGGEAAIPVGTAGPNRRFQISGLVGFELDWAHVRLSPTQSERASSGSVDLGVRVQY